MASAGVKLSCGREGKEVYGERNWNWYNGGLASINIGFPNRHFNPYVVPGDPTSGLCQRYQKEDPGKAQRVTIRSKPML